MTETWLESERQQVQSIRFVKTTLVYLLEYRNWNFSDQIPEGKSIGRTIPLETSQLRNYTPPMTETWLESE